jgi:hypothetical protein
MDISLIEMMPGYIVHDATPGHVVLTIPSEFKLRLDRIGPYIFDDLFLRPDLKDIGPFMIKVILLEKIQPPGIEQWVEYVPPRDDDGNLYIPDMDEFPKEWAYYHQWLAHSKKRNDIATVLEYERIQRSLLAGLHILDGPISIDDHDIWYADLEGTVPAPQSRAEWKLLFLKMVVIRPLEAGNIIRDFMIAEEVTVEGIKAVFDRFRRQMERSASK